jgi:hypothetical protein
LRTAANTAIGASASVAQTATLNKLEGKNDSLGAAAGFGGLFAGLGSAASDIIPALSAAANQNAFDAMSLQDKLLLLGLARTNAPAGNQHSLPPIQA